MGQKSDRQKVAMRPNGRLCKIILPVREVRNDNHEIPEKGPNPEKGPIPKMDLTFFSMFEVLTGYCKMLLSTVLK